jgi:hypothetical protein
MRLAVALAVLPLFALPGCVDEAGLAFEPVASCGQPARRDINVTRPADLAADGGALVEVRVLLVSPGAGCFVGHAFTNPSAAIVVDWPKERGGFRPVVASLRASQACGPS